VSPDYYCFRFEAEVKGDEWKQLLEQDVLLHREETNFVVQLCDGNEPIKEVDVQSRRKLDRQCSNFLVHADRSIDAIMKIQNVLQRDPSRSTGSLGEAFSVYFETKVRLLDDHHQLIDRLAGGEAYIRTCADAVDHKTEGYTVKATLDVLARALRPIWENNVIHCSLRVDNPSPDTLGRFINACQKAKKYPGTLGVDCNINRYFCRKNLGDIKLILEYMADYSTSSKIEGDFKIFELSSEDQPF
jgi:hypothetical protein